MVDLADDNWHTSSDDGATSGLAWDDLCALAGKANACEAIAHACLARHKAEARVLRWQPLYRAAVRCKGGIGSRHEWRHVRIGGKLTEAMNVYERLEDAELEACERWGGKL